MGTTTFKMIFFGILVLLFLHKSVHAALCEKTDCDNAESDPDKHAYCKVAIGGTPGAVNDATGKPIYGVTHDACTVRCPKEGLAAWADDPASFDKCAKLYIKQVEEDWKAELNKTCQPLVFANFTGMTDEFTKEMNNMNNMMKKCNKTIKETNENFTELITTYNATVIKSIKELLEECKTNETAAVTEKIKTLNLEECKKKCLNATAWEETEQKEEWKKYLKPSVCKRCPGGSGEGGGGGEGCANVHNQTFKADLAFCKNSCFDPKKWNETQTDELKAALADTCKSSLDDATKDKLCKEVGTAGNTTDCPVCAGLSILESNRSILLMLLFSTILFTFIDKKDC